MYRRAYHDIFFLNGAPKPSNRQSFRTRTVYRESLGINWSCVWTTPIRYPTNDRWWVGEPTRKVRSTCLTEINRSWWYLERFVFYAPRLHLSSRSRWDERIGREFRFVTRQKLFVHLMNSGEIIKIINCDDSLSWEVEILYFYLKLHRKYYW